MAAALSLENSMERNCQWGCLVRCVLRLAAVYLLAASPLVAQTPTTFRYFYDDLGQLNKVLDSSGNTIEYIYDAVGNILQVNRNTVSPSALAILGFTPSQGASFNVVTIQ